MTANTIIYHTHHIIPIHEWRRRYGSERALDETGRNLDHPTNLMPGLTTTQHAEEHRKLWEQNGNLLDYTAWQALSGQMNMTEAKKLAKLEGCKLGGKISGGKNKGKKASVATREKLRLSHLGHIPSIETREKMSKSRKGENHPMFGKHHSEETKQKLRNRKFTKETRLKMSLSHRGPRPWARGRKISKETRIKMSIAQKKRFALSRISLLEG